MDYSNDQIVEARLAQAVYRRKVAMAYAAETRAALARVKAIKDAEAERDEFLRSIGVNVNHMGDIAAAL